MASRQSNAQPVQPAPTKISSMLKSAPSNKAGNQVIPIGCFCFAIAPQVDSVTAESDARTTSFFPSASHNPSAPAVASVPNATRTETVVQRITRTEFAAAPPPKYIQFFISPDSEGAGSVRWKAEWLREVGVFKLLPPINHAIPATSSTTVALGIIVLSRKEIKPKTPGKRNQLENRKNAITTALEAALKESRNYRGRDHVVQFFRSAILELEKTGNVHLPMIKVKGLTIDTWTPDPEPLLEEMVSLWEEMHAAGHGYKMEFAWNSW